jgi:hypothetical protein
VKCDVGRRLTSLFSVASLHKNVVHPTHAMSDYGKGEKCEIRHDYDNTDLNAGLLDRMEDPTLLHMPPKSSFLANLFDDLRQCNSIHALFRVEMMKKAWRFSICTHSRSNEQAFINLSVIYSYINSRYLHAILTYKRDT